MALQPIQTSALVTEFLSLHHPSRVLLRGLFLLGTNPLTCLTDDTEGTVQRRQQEAVWAPSHVLNTQARVPPCPPSTDQHSELHFRVSDNAVNVSVSPGP